MFGGFKGGTSRSQLLEIMDEFRDVNEAQSVLLLGCYTGVQNEIIGWKQIFPKARLIGGYDGTAPLSDRPAGHEYLSDLLTKEQQLIREADQSRLDVQVRNGIRSINVMNTALWINPLCEDGTSEMELYYASSEGRRLTPFEINACTSKSDELRAISLEYEKYMAGELEPPADTGPNGALRQLYNRARRNQHCAEQLNINFDSDKLLFLLFYEGTKKNFGTFYQEDLQAAESLLNSITPESMRAVLDQEIQAANARLQESRTKLASLPDQESEDAVFLRKVIMQDERLIRNSERTIEEYTRGPEKLRSLWVPTAQNLGSKTRSELMANTHALHELLSSGGLTDEQRRVISWVNNRVATHLEKFNNPYEWHEFTGFPATPESVVRLADFKEGSRKVPQ